jgi:hypothetical protein
MKTCFKAPLIALSALALLAGCKSQHKAGFLRTDADAVKFIQWTRGGMQIRGAINILERKPDNGIRTTSATFDGVLDGDNVNMTTRGGGKEPGEKITGRLNGDTLTLFLEGGSEPKEFRRATATEYDKAVKNLKMRAALNKGAYFAD